MWYIAGYEVEDGILTGAPCACFADDHAGHPVCQSIPEGLLIAERYGQIGREYEDGVWRWRVSDAEQRRMNETDELFRRR